MTTAYTASNQIPMSALPTASGIVQNFVASATNVGAATYAPDGLSASPIFGLGALQLQGNEIVSGGIVTLESYIGPLLNSGALCWVLLDCVGGSPQVANAVQSQQAITLGQVQALLAALLPSGTIIDFAGATAPAGYLACPTSQTNISRTTYAALFAAIGTTWGAGDGSTTFGMPWFPAGYVASQANSNVGTQTVGQVISHSHGYIFKGASGNGTDGWEGVSGVTMGDISTDAAGGAANLAAGVYVKKCVKA